MIDAKQVLNAAAATGFSDSGRNRLHRGAVTPTEINRAIGMPKQTCIACSPALKKTVFCSANMTGVPIRRAWLRAMATGVISSVRVRAARSR